MKPKVRFLVPVWGEAYIYRFAELSLPSFLAPGNLPALAEMTDLEICLLTTSSHYPHFDRLPAVGELRQVAPLRFIEIDDIVADGHTGVTLTLAYLRGIVETGAEMTERHFLFMNSDIVLADGSFRGVARKLLEGNRVILANSIRAVSEELEPQLRREVHPAKHVLAIPPRRLVTMAMGALHPLQIAKIVNSDLCHSTQVNQFYWQADTATLISRHFLMFMLCLKPERVVTEVQSFCDYSFVPEFCPSGGAVALADSDDFFALELQHRQHEASYLRIGRAPLEDIAASLSEWTTDTHRANALNHTLIFHGNDLPPNTRAICAEADRYIRHLVALLPPKAQPYRLHPYWIGAYRSWQLRRSEFGLGEATNQPEAALESDSPSRTLHLLGLEAVVDRLSAWPSTATEAAWRLIGRLRQFTMGQPPEVPIWHPDWLDYRPLRAILRRRLAQNPDKILYVTEQPVFRRWLKDALIIRPAQMLTDDPQSPPIARHSLNLVLVELSRDDLHNVRAMLDRLRPLMEAGGQIVLFHRERAAWPAQDLESQLLNKIGFAMPLELHKTRIWFAGGEEKRHLRADFIAMMARMSEPRLIGLPIVACRALWLVARAVLINRRQARLQDQHLSVAPCSSFVMTVTI